MPEAVTLHPGARPRMADHAEALAALDQATGTNGLPAYLRASSRALEDAIEGNLVALAVERLMAKRDSWGPGTATELLTELKPHEVPKDWPATPRHLSGQLRRAAQLLEEAGIQVEIGLRYDDGHRGIKMTRMPRESSPSLSPASWKDDQDDQ